MVTLIRNKTQGLLAFTLILSLLGLAACEKKAPIGETGAQGDQLFNNRPSEATTFVAVAKLKSPALFGTAQLQNGKAVIDPKALEAINAEQAQFLEQLAKVSSETKVLYKYRMVLNGFAITGPIADLEKIQGLVQVTSIEKGGGFTRPKSVENEGTGASANLREHNSVKFIGAENLHRRTITNQKGESVPLNGTGVKVGVLDTGIDFTHSMLGGWGSAELYKSINPSQPTDFFPNNKVVGGIDLVGTDFDSGSLDFSRHIPKIDSNPIDEGGHGTHVAGSIAGIGDGVETYSGVAPGAQLYAIKVFGKDGSTSDAVVIAGFEYSADPNGDGNPDDQLDVINLSLGSPFGGGKILYTEAVQNLTHGGTVVVASAGNEGDTDYITGAPAVSDAAISVAAGIDDGDHNWKFPAVKFTTPTQGSVVVEAVEASFSKPIAEAGDVRGNLVFIGLADAPLSEEVKAQLKGNVALIDRGKIAFADKTKLAVEAGAVGVVVANNVPGSASAMGGEGKFDVPAIMISQAVGATLKEELAKGAVSIQFKTADKIDKPELIDTITDFSSKGPRSEDSLIKPEITAPGSSIISAKMGGGQEAVKMSGTSMSGPHVAGAMALLKQAFPTLSVADLKALALNRAKTIADAEGKTYPISRQGSGRIRIDESVDTKVMLEQATLSLGEVALESRKTVRKTLTLRNMTQEAQVVDVKLVKRGEGLSLRNSQQVSLAAGERKTLTLEFVLDATGMKELVREMDGWVIAEQGQKEISRVPVLAVARKVSNVSAVGLTVEAGSNADAAGAAATLTLKNTGKNAGDALLFNLLAKDSRKSDASNDLFLSRACDLQSVGYRIVEKTVGNEKLKVLQIAAKIYEPLTHWKQCELSVQIDSNGDQLAEQELAAITLDNVPGLENPQLKYKMVSALFDAGKMREMRREFEKEALTSKEKVKEDYSDALITSMPLTPFDHSTIMIVEADISKISRRATGEIGIKVAVQELGGSAIEADDFLKETASKWVQLSLNESSQSFVGMPEKISIAAGSTQSVELEKGFGRSALMVLLPQNLTVFSNVVTDQQQILLLPKYQQP